MGAVQLAGRRLVVTAAWGPGRSARRDGQIISPLPSIRVENPATPVPVGPAQASRPATVATVPMSPTERAKTAAAARSEALSPERRAEIAAKASAAGRSPLTRVRQFARSWAEATDEERAAALPELVARFGEIAAAATDEQRREIRRALRGLIR